METTLETLVKEKEHVSCNIKTNFFSNFPSFKIYLEKYLKQLTDKIKVQKYIEELIKANNCTSVDDWVMCKLCMTKDLDLASWDLPQKTFLEVCKIQHELSDGDVKEGIFSLCARENNVVMLKKLLGLATSTAEDTAALDEALLQAQERFNRPTAFGYPRNPFSDMIGFTAMHFACLQGHTEVVSLLLPTGILSKIAAKAEVSCTTPSPLQLAAAGGHVDVVRVLLQHILSFGREPSSQLQEFKYCTITNGFSVFHYAIAGQKNWGLNVESQQRIEVINILLAADEHVRQQRPSKRSRLSNDNNRLGIDSGTDCDFTMHKDKDGNTALHLACIDGHLDAVKLLVPLQDLNVLFATQNQDGMNFKEVAKSHGNEGIVTWISEHVRVHKGEWRGEGGGGGDKQQRSQHVSIKREDCRRRD